MDIRSQSISPNPIVAADVATIVADLGVRLQSLSGSTLLITGANGFLCSYIVDVIAAFNDLGGGQPCKIIAVDNLQTGHASRLAHLLDRPDVEFIRHDVSTPFEMTTRADWIVHGASIASPPVYRRFPLETIDANVSGTRHMLDLAHSQNVRGMLYISTSEIYGDPDPANIPTAEEYRGYVSCVGPRACYDESKRMAETLCVTYAKLYGLPVGIIRPFNVYGPGLRLDDGRIIPDLMAAAVKRRPIILYSDGRATRSFCYVSDAVSAMLYVLLSGQSGAIFNVGNDEREISMADLATELSAVTPPPGLAVEMRASSDKEYVVDNPQRRCPDLRKIRAAFPWKPKVGLRAGLQRTLKSYLLGQSTSP